MFGYIRPFKSEMLVKEYGQYKAVYCELCRVLGREYGPLSRMALSFDCTFYAMLALSVTGEEVCENSARCVADPLKKCTYISSSGEAYKKASALSVLLTYHKLRDDIEDSGFFRSLLSRLLLPFVSGKAKKAEKRYPFLGKIAREAMESQSEAEKTRAGIDRCAEPTAHLLEELFGELSEDEGQKRCLRQLGYYLGRWVYLMDAADDLQEDVKKGGFNPFAVRLGIEGKREITEEERQKADTECNEALNACISFAVPALNLLELKRFGSVLENIIGKGLPEMQREILFLHVHDKRKKIKARSEKI